MADFGEVLGPLGRLWPPLGRLWALSSRLLEVFGSPWGALGEQVSRELIILTVLGLHFGDFGRPKATLEDTKSDVETKKSLQGNSYFQCRIYIKN